MRSRFSTDASWIVLIAGGYFLGARLGLKVSFVANGVSAVSPSAGVALAAFLLRGYRFWPAVTGGALLANLSAGEPVATAVGIAAGNTFEALVGAWLLTRCTAFENGLQRFRDALALIMLGAGCSTALGATIGVSALCLGQVQSWASFGRLWGVWWFGDAMGDLVIAPAILIWATQSWRRKWPVSLITEAVILVAVLLTVCLVTFGNVAPSVQTPHAYGVIPVVVWAAIRFRQLGTTVSMLAVSAIASIGTLLGHGPFVEGSANASLNVLQMFMAVTATTGLLLAAATSEREAAVSALRESDKYKDEFLATLAHELRNPLAPISNVMQCFRLDVPSDPRVRKLTEIIERQVRQMTRLVDDLLDISRITRNKLELRKELIDLESIVESAVETARPVIELHAHVLSVILPPEPIQLVADPVRLAQVFSNLLQNAGKFTPPGGHIEILVERRASEVVVTVRDNGVGIPTTELSRVFEMFMQSSHSTKRSLRGLGIGLALAKRLVEMHGGAIVADSQGPGQGSEFRVCLPVVIPPPLKKTESPDGDRRCASRMRSRILVVDDNMDSAESLSLLLSIVGNEVRQACDGLAAIEIAENYRPEIVLLDIGMPVVDGYEVVRRIRSREWGTEIVLIALTGWGQEEDRRRFAEAGFDYHLTKPVDLSALRGLLEALRARASTSV